MRPTTLLRRPKLNFLSLLADALFFSAPAHAGTIDFESFPLGAVGYYNGSDFAGGFTTGGATFANSFTDFGGGFFGWDGWSVSNHTDTETPGFGNQYSTYAPGGGFGGGASIGILNGTVGEVGGGVLTVITESGETRVNLGEQVVIQIYETGTLEDISTGDRVLVITATDDESGEPVTTTSIVVNPPEGGFGGGGGFGGRPQRP